MAQILGGSQSYKGINHKRKASANKLIIDSSAHIQIGPQTTTTNSNIQKTTAHPSRISISQLQHINNNLTTTNNTPANATHSNFNSHFSLPTSGHQTTTGANTKTSMAAVASTTSAFSGIPPLNSKTK